MANRRTAEYNAQTINNSPTSLGHNIYGELIHGNYHMYHYVPEVHNEYVGQPITHIVPKWHEHAFGDTNHHVIAHHGVPKQMDMCSPNPFRVDNHLGGWKSNFLIMKDASLRIASRVNPLDVGSLKTSNIMSKLHRTSCWSKSH